MKEGWHNDDYLILFERHEVEQKEQAYGINRLLPGYTLLGLIGWDDFLLMERATQKLFRIPTLPVASEQRKEWQHSLDSIRLQPDEQFHRKVKWYVKPIIFGGDPNPGQNITWISHDEHVQAVKYWNDLYSHARK